MKLAIFWIKTSISTIKTYNFEIFTTYGMKLDCEETYLPPGFYIINVKEKLINRY